jgi:hypothetical protein
MIKMTQLALAGAVAIVLSGVGLAQDPSLKPPGTGTTYFAGLVDNGLNQDPIPEALPGQQGVGGGVVQALPRPKDLPSSLFAPPSAVGPGPFSLVQPYLITDPLLDPDRFSQPGWFVGGEIQVLKSNLLPQSSGSVQNSAQKARNTSTNVQLPSASLDWTVSPRVFLGYRLPSGFGEFMVAYRHLGTQGSGMTPGQSGPLGLSTRFAFDIIDLDYASREFCLGTNYNLKWTLGLRSLFLFFDSEATQSSGQAGAGNGLTQARQSNNMYGIGPHLALEVTRRIRETNFSLYGWVDAAGTYDFTNEGFSTQSATLGPNGRPLFGQNSAFGHQATPMINGRVGLTWQPGPTSPSRIFVGYQYEVIWDLDRVPNDSATVSGNSPSLGQFWDQGIVFQATFRY